MIGFASIPNHGSALDAALQEPRPAIATMVDGTVDPATLRPGDHLLYWSHCLADYVIALKTYTLVGHIEVFAGEPFSKGRYWSTAVRIGGVDLYPFRPDGLRFVLRPKVWDEAAATRYFKSVRGQKYDWLGLLCFTLAVKQGAPDRKFCSEYARNLDRVALRLPLAGGGTTSSFADAWPGDKTAPGAFLASPAFDLVYDSKAEVPPPTQKSPSPL